MQLNTIWIFILLIFACSKFEEREVYFEDGRVQAVYTVQHDSEIKHGPYRIFHEDGYLYETGLYHLDTIDGQRTMYYPDGDTQIVEYYNKGTIHGPYKVFYESGQIEVDGSFTNGKIRGQWHVYYPSGQLKEVVTFRDNEENGPFTEYYENGQLKAQGTYLDGDNEHGELLLYDTNGRLVRKMQCDRGICSTTWKLDSIPQSDEG